MSQQRARLYALIEEEKKLYIRKNALIESFTHKKRYLIWKYLKAFRQMKFYQDSMQRGTWAKKTLSKILYYHFLRQMNIIGEKCGIEIANNCSLGKNINIYHGGVIISGATIGDNCTIRGNTVIGNKGLVRYDGEPVIGNNVEIGAGAAIIGNIIIADGCEIGANAVVTKSFQDPDSIIAGVPGKIIGRK